MISPNPSLATKSALLPWSGQIYVQCDGQQKVWTQFFKPQNSSIMNAVCCYENLIRVECVQCDWLRLLRSRFVKTWLWMYLRHQQTQPCQPCLLRLPPQSCQSPGFPPRPCYLCRSLNLLKPWWRSTTRRSSSLPHSQGKHQVRSSLIRGRKLVLLPGIRTVIA